MKERLKNFIIPFILMMIFDLSYYYLTLAPNFGQELNPHLGILFIAGLFFGPFGSLGAVVANLIGDIVRGYSIPSAIASAVISFAISYLAYKLWYTKNSKDFPNTKPRLNNTFSLAYLMVLVITCAVLYSTLIANITEIFYPETIGNTYHIGLQYFTNFVNFGFLSSVICILLSGVKDFTHTPKISESFNEKIYDKIYLLIMIMLGLNILLDYTFNNYEINVISTVILILLLYIYIRKPITKIEKIEYISIPERVMKHFVSLTLILIIIDFIVIFTPLWHRIIDVLHFIATNQQYLIMMLILDGSIILFFIPALALLHLVENKVINPIKSFSKIESFVKKDKKIETEGLIELYSKYIDQEDEIGVLSRSYTNLINYNNEYIENVKNLESERQKITTELNIAHNIQHATLPNTKINNEYIRIEGYCKAAKEVGGDFYDYYEIDEDNTVIVIGDASGKGVPAAIFTMITQNSINVLIKNELNPAEVLNDINNRICERNSEMMFITLFLAVYNNKKHRLTYANAGHNPPIIKSNDKFNFLDIDSEIVMGVLDDYEYKNHEITLDDEIILYTDGITDAQNTSQELYGEERLLKHLNTQKNEDIIGSLISDINNFTKNEEQFDDMTLLILKVK